MRISDWISDVCSSDLADRYGITVIEDAAQSFGATYRGRRSCALSTIATTSFFPSKPLGCYGDGGALFTADAKLARSLRRIDRKSTHLKLQSLMRTSYAVFCLQNKTTNKNTTQIHK